MEVEESASQPYRAVEEALEVLANPFESFFARRRKREQQAHLAANGGLPAWC
jgi:hypothetical protein